MAPAHRVGYELQVGPHSPWTGSGPPVPNTSLCARNASWAR